MKLDRKEYMRPQPNYTVGLQGRALQSGQAIVDVMAAKVAEEQEERANLVREVARLRLLVENQEAEIKRLKVVRMVEGTTCPSPIKTSSIILRAVADASGVSVDDILGPTRSRTVAYPRFMAAVLLIELRSDLSFPSIAKLLNRADHTTIMSALRKTYMLSRGGLFPDYWVTLRRQFNLPDEMPRILRGRDWSLKSFPLAQLPGRPRGSGKKNAATEVK